MPSGSPRTLVLDLDGTLVDSLPDLLASCNRMMAARGLVLFDADEVRPMIGDGAAALVSRLLAARSQTAGPSDLDSFLADYMAHAAALSRLYPGAVETLDALAAQGWHLAVCTNKPAAAARDLLQAFGVLDRFAAIGGGDSFPTRKPEPGHLLATLAEAGGTPDRAVMVGDHHNDIAAAAGAGVRAIFAAWGYGTPAMAGAAPVARSFADVRRLLAEMP